MSDEWIHMPPSGCEAVSVGTSPNPPDYIPADCTPSCQSESSSYEDTSERDEGVILFSSIAVTVLGVLKYAVTKIGPSILSKGAASLVKKFMPYVPTPEEKKIFGDLSDPTNNIRSFMDAMRFLVEVGYAPKDAFEGVVKYILLRKTPTTSVPSPDVIDYYFSLTVGDAWEMKKTYGISYQQMAYIIDMVGEQVKKKGAAKELEGVVYQAMPRSIAPDEAKRSPEMIKAITTTQDRRRRIEQRIEERYVEALTGHLRDAIARMGVLLEGSAVSETRFAIRIDNREIVVDTSIVPVGERKRYLEDIRTRLTYIYSEISKRKRFFDSDLAPLEELGRNVPGLIAIRPLDGTAIGDSSDAQDNAIRLLSIALDEGDPRSPAVRELFQLARSRQTPVAYQLNGEDVRVLVFGLPFTPENAPEVYVGGSAEVGPYTFYPSYLVKIGGDGKETREAAMVYLDRRGRGGVISARDMERLNRLEGELWGLVESDPDDTRRSKHFDAFASFLDDVRSAWDSLDWEDEKMHELVPASERGRLSQRTKLMKRMRWGYELTRTLRSTIREVLDVKRYGLSGSDDYKLIAKEGIAYIRSTYQKFFDDAGFGGEFQRRLEALEQALIGGDERSINIASTRLKKTIFSAMDKLGGGKSMRMSGNVLTPLFGEEVRAWTRMAEKGIGRVSDSEIEAAASMRENIKQEPSMEYATKLFAEGREVEALNEYARYLITPGTPVEKRIQACRQLFRLARASRHPTSPSFMDKALREMVYIISTSSYNITGEDLAFIREAIEAEGRGGPRVPSLLKEIYGKSYVSAAARFISDVLTQDGVPPFEFGGRFDLLREGAKRRIDAMIKERATMGLAKFDEGWLREVATMTPDEVQVRIVTVGEIGERDVQNLMDFHREAFDIVRTYGYDEAKVSSHPAAQAIAVEKYGGGGEKKTLEAARGKTTETGEDVSIRPSSGRLARISREVRPVFDMLEGGLVFWAGMSISELVTEGKVVADVGGIGRDYLALTAGSEVGRAGAISLLKVLQLGEGSISSLAIERGIPLFGALVTLELVRGEELDIKTLTLNAANVGAASFITSAALSCIRNSSTLTKVMKTIRIISNTGKLSLVGLILSTAAEFVIIKLLSSIEEEMIRAGEVRAFKQSLARALAADQSVIGRLSSGEDVPLKEALSAEALLLHHIRVIDEFYKAEEENIRERYRKKKEELSEWYRREYVRPLDGTWSRSELEERYTARLHALKEEEEKEVGKLVSRREMVFNRLPSDLTGPHPYRELFDNISEEDLEPLDIDGEHYPTKEEEGYKRLLADDLLTIKAQIEQYVRDRNRALIAIWNKNRTKWLLAAQAGGGF